MEDIERKLAAIRGYYLEVAADRYYDDLNELDGAAESPIERLMAAALVAVFSRSEILPHFVFWQGMPAFGTESPIVAAQFPLGKHARLDFVVACNYGNRDGAFVVAVECDGHDFHERTKEQARRDRSRDRMLQGIGWSILRFTGAEIWEDALGCARQVEKFVHEKRFG